MRSFMLASAVALFVYGAQTSAAQTTLPSYNTGDASVITVQNTTDPNYRYHNGQWWYRTGDNWMYWNNGAWSPYTSSRANTTYGTPNYYGNYRSNYGYQYPSNNYNYGRYSSGYRGYGAPSYNSGYYGSNGYYGAYGSGYRGYGSGYGGYGNGYGYSQGANIGAAIGNAIGGQQGANIGAAIGAGVR